MIIDINAHLGLYAFRQLPHHEAHHLLGQMDKHGIGHAVVCSNPAITYRDTHVGNEELWAAISDQPRFTGIATINPLYSGWEADLETALCSWRFKGVRLLPTYHGYTLESPAAHRVLQLCVRYDVPLVLAQRIEDRRQRHLWDTANDLRFADVALAVRTHPNLKLLLQNWIGLEGHAIRDAGLQNRVLIDLTRFDVVLHGLLPQLIDVLGPQAIAFGTHAPFNYIGPALVRLECLSISDTEREMIASRNAIEFLNLNIASKPVSPQEVIHK